MLADAEFGVHDGDDVEVGTTCAVIPASAVHSLTGHGQSATLLYLQHVGGSARGGAGQWAARARHLEYPSSHRDLVGWVAEISAQLRHPKDDPQGYVGAAMAAGRSALPGRVVLGDIARQVGVAPATLSRQFTQVVGVSWRRWVLTERLRIAAASLADGTNLTQAAHAAGFADSAHLTRTFRRMFGIAPSDLTAVATWHVH